MNPVIEKLKSFVHPSDINEDKLIWASWEEFESYYYLKKLIIECLNPTKVAEFGVRFGYSGFIFLSNPSVKCYHGYDNFTGIHGGNAIFPDAWEFTLRENLLREYSDKTVEIYRTDTQKLTDLNHKYDFIHVDADHTENGCYNDITLAFNSLYPGGWILVDDYDFLKPVKFAVNKWIKNNQMKLSEVFYIHSLRGEILIKKNDLSSQYLLNKCFKRLNNIDIKSDSLIKKIFKKIISFIKRLLILIKAL